MPNLSLHYADLIFLSKQTCLSLWSLNKHTYGQLAGSLWPVELESQPGFIQSSLPCVLEFLAEHCSSQLPALWTFGLQPQHEHAGHGIRHNLSQSPARRHVAVLCCGWPCIACQEQSVVTISMIDPPKLPAPRNAQGLIKLEMARDSQEVIWYFFRVWGFRI